MNSSTSNSEGRGYGLVMVSALFVCLAVWLACTLPSRGTEHPTVRSVRALMEAKERAVAGKEGRRLLLGGPSNVHFSLQAGLLGRELGMEACNMGLLNPMTGPYLREWVSRHARGGDAVIWVPPFDDWVESPEMSLMLAGYVRAWDPGYLRGLSWRARAMYGMGWPMVSEESPDLGLLEGWLRGGGRGRGAGLEMRLGEYVDENGDLLEEYHREYLRQGRTYGSAARPVAVVDVRRLPERRALESFLRWRAELRDRGVEVAVCWPSMVESPFYRCGKFLEAHARLEQALRSEGVVVLGRPEDFFLQPGEIFDSSYHALPHGRERLTRRLAELCREAHFPAFGKTVAGPPCGLFLPGGGEAGGAAGEGLAQ